VAAPKTANDDVEDGLKVSWQFPDVNEADPLRAHAPFVETASGKLAGVALSGHIAKKLCA